MALTPLGAGAAGGRLSAEDERERQTEDRERLGEGEAEERDRLEQAARLGLAGDAVDVGGEDETDADAGADGRQAVAEDRDVSGHVGSFPSFDRRCWRRRWCERFPGAARCRTRVVAAVVLPRWCCSVLPGGRSDAS